MNRSDVMVVVRIRPEMRMAIVGAPAYLEARRIPATPHDLASHTCINLRFQARAGVAVWTSKGMVGPSMSVRLGAINALGLAYLPRDYLQAFIDSGELISVLEDWCPPFAGYHLHYPSRRQHSSAFALIVDALRYRD